MLLEARGVSRSFLTGDKQIIALETISVTVDSGDFLVITGPSGSGKSTLLYLLSGLDCPSTGSIIFRDTEISNITSSRRAILRNEHFGFMFQTPHLLMEKTVKENVLLPFYYGKPANSTQANERCNELLDYVGLQPLADRYPNTLSGGEMQRVVFARALCRNPDIIFADEPTGSLDADNSIKILQLLKNQAESGRAVIMASHDPTAISYASRSLLINKFTGREQLE